MPTKGLNLTPEALKKRGQRARNRAQERAPTSRIRAQDWYPELAIMLDDGMSKAQICKATHLSIQRVNEILAGTDLMVGLESAILGDSKAHAALSAECQAMLPFTADAFELFFNAYAEYPTGLQPLHKGWVEEFISNINLLLNVPPRHAKSTIFSVWVPIWLLCRNRNEQILLVSAGEKLAKIFAYQIDQQLRLNINLIKDWGRFAPVNPKDSVWSPRSGEMIVTGRDRENRTGQFSILCRGAGQHILGIEATVVICDDPTNARVSKSEIQRQERMTWIREYVLSRLEPEIEGEVQGHACIIGQRVHLHDLYGELSEDEDEETGEKVWCHINQPMVLRWPEEEDGSDALLLWPGRFNWKHVRTIRNRAGSGAFSTMYQQDPLPDEAAFIQAAWWEGCRDRNRTVGEGSRPDVYDGSTEQPILPIVRVLSIDPSPTQWNSYVVADCVASRSSFFCQMLDLGHWKGGPREMRHQIDRLIALYRPDYFIMERSAVSAWFQSETFYQEISQRCRVLPHATGANKWDPELGLLSLAADIEGARISLPYKDEKAVAMSRLFEDECNRYGHGFPDDIMMAVWFIKVNFRKLRPIPVNRDHFDERTKRPWGYIRRAKATPDQERLRQAAEWRKNNAKRFGVKV